MMIEKKPTGAEGADLSKLNTEELNALFDDLSAAFDRGEKADISLYRAVAEELEKRAPLPGGDKTSSEITKEALGRFRAFTGEKKKEKTVRRGGRARILVLIAAAALALSVIAALGAYFSQRREDPPPVESHGESLAETTSAHPTGKETTPADPTGKETTTPETEHGEKAEYRVMSQLSHVGNPNYSSSSWLSGAFKLEEYELWSEENAEEHEDLTAPREMTVTFDRISYTGTYRYTRAPRYSDHFVHGYLTEDGAAFEVSAENGLLEMLRPAVQEDRPAGETLDTAEQFRLIKRMAYELEPLADTLFNDYQALKHEDGSFTCRFLVRILADNGELIELSEYIEITVDSFGNLTLLDAPMRGKLAKDQSKELNNVFSALHRRRAQIVKEKERELYGAFLLETDFFPTAVITRLTSGEQAVVYVCYEIIDARSVGGDAQSANAEERIDATVIYILVPNR